jgi:hypothetical protein
VKYDSNVVTLISLDKSIVEEAFRHAMKRIEFEYDRFGLNLEKRIAMIALGTVGQLVFRDYLSSQNVNFEFEYQAGKFDNFDFRIDERIIEVKTSGFDDSIGWSHLNAIYNHEQLLAAQKKNIFASVQIFTNGYSPLTRVFDGASCTKAVIAGFAPVPTILASPKRKLPYGDAHLVPLSTLSKIEDLLS